MKINMIFSAVGALLLGANVATAAVVARAPTTTASTATVTPTSTLVSLPQSAANKNARASALATKKAGWGYGPTVLGGPGFPTGTLGQARIQSDLGAFNVDNQFITNALNTDIQLVQQAVGANGGLKSLDDYSTLLYQNQWKNSIPSGEDAGILTNYTQDLEFSMERLSLNPYSLRRVGVKDTLPAMNLAAADVVTITSTSLASLQSAGRLFYIDHSYQDKYPKNPRFGAACSALFFIHPASGDFLPLAIKTNVGANLTYTKLDTANDWLLAKIMFNTNDLFFAEMFHLAASHDVGEPILTAAQRTLSVDHPVMALLDRLMTEGYAARVVGAQVLFNPGGAFDQIFYVNSTGAIQFVTEFNLTAGNYMNNFLEIDLAARGLINSKIGPAFKSFPFYEDALIVRNNIKAFMTSFVNAYYTRDALMASDIELQAFFQEVSGPAQVINFPCSHSTASECSRRTTLIDALTHFAWLTGAAHHVLNTGNLVTALATLPFHTAAIYSPVPTTKGVTDLLPFMPPVPAALFQINLDGAFNRPQYESQNKTLAFAYSDPAFLSRFNAAVGTAAATYNSAMLNFSQQVRARTFDANGLSQGMPFIYKSLDPGTIPYFFAI